MKKYLIIAILFVFLGGGTVLFAAGKQEAPGSAGENVQNTAKDEEIRDKDWSERISSEKKENKAARIIQRESPPVREKEPGPESAPAPEIINPADTSKSITTGLAANFNPAGLSLGGSVSASINFGELGNADDTVYLLLSVRPQFGFFLLPKFSLTLTPSFYWKNILESGGSGNNIMYLGISAGVLYYFYSGAPIIPALGTDLGIRFYPEAENTISYFTITAEPQFYTYFFVNDNFAPYIGLGPDIAIFLLEGTSAITLDISLSFGFSVFLPGAVNARY